MNTANVSIAATAILLRFPHPIDGLAGTSFKHEHLPAILGEGPQRDFFEVHAENYMGAGGPPHRSLETIRRNHPVSLHGVCMSIGAPRPLDHAHLVRSRNLVNALAAFYPAVQRITGVDFFRAMARSHIRATPPSCSNMDAIFPCSSRV
jgi:hypothetical protein